LHRLPDCELVIFHPHLRVIALERQARLGLSSAQGRGFPYGNCLASRRAVGRRPTRREHPVYPGTSDAGRKNLAVGGAGSAGAPDPAFGSGGPEVDR
jgi:hypothetical protein